MKKQLLSFIVTIFLANFATAQSISFTGATLTTAQIGSTITVNYQYTIPANGNIYCAINLYNNFTWSSMVVDGALSPAPTGTNMTGSFNFTIPNGTTPTSNLTGNFNYKIVIELNNATWNWQAGAYPTNQINLTAPLSTSDFENNSISVYPNPTNDFIYVQGVENTTKSQVVITDMLGKKVFSSSQLNVDKIDVSNLNSGIYILSISSNDSQKMVKFIKR